MNKVYFDTLKFVQHLEKAGVPTAHAKAKAEALVEVFNSAGRVASVNTDVNLCPRSDSSEMRELRAEMRDLELRLTIKLGAFLLASVGATVALLRAFP